MELNNIQDLPPQLLTSKVVKVEGNEHLSNNSKSVLERWNYLNQNRLEESMKSINVELSNLFKEIENTTEQRVSIFMEDFAALMTDHLKSIKTLQEFIELESISEEQLQNVDKQIQANMLYRKKSLKNFELQIFDLQQFGFNKSQIIILNYMNETFDLHHGSPYDAIIDIGDIITKYNLRSVDFKQKFNQFLIKLYNMENKFSLTLEENFVKIKNVWKDFKFNRLMNIILKEIGSLSLTGDQEMITCYHEEQSNLLNEMNFQILDLLAPEVTEWNENWYQNKAKEIYKSLSHMKNSLQKLNQNVSIFRATRKEDLERAVQRWRKMLLENGFYIGDSLEVAVDGLREEAWKKIEALPQREEEFELFGNSIIRHHQCVSLILNFFLVIMHIRSQQILKNKKINHDIEELGNKVSQTHQIAIKDLLEKYENLLKNLQHSAVQEGEKSLIQDYTLAKKLIQQIDYVHREYEIKSIGIIKSLVPETSRLFDQYLTQLFEYLHIKVEDDLPDINLLNKDSQTNSFLSIDGHRFVTEIDSNLAHFMFSKTQEWTKNTENLDSKIDFLPQFALFQDPKLLENGLLYNFMTQLQQKMINDMEKWKNQCIHVATWKAESIVEKLQFENNSLIYETEQKSKQLEKIYEVCQENLRHTQLIQNREATVIKAKADTAKSVYNSNIDKLATSAEKVKNLLEDYKSKLVKSRTMEQTDYLHGKYLDLVTVQKRKFAVEYEKIQLEFDREIQIIKQSRLHHEIAWRNLDLELTTKSFSLIQFDKCIDEIHNFTFAFKEELNVYGALKRAITLFKMEFKKMSVSCDSLFDKIHEIITDYESTYYTDSVTINHLDENYKKIIRMLENMSTISNRIGGYKISVPKDILTTFNFIFKGKSEKYEIFQKDEQIKKDILETLKSIKFEFSDNSLKSTIPYFQKFQEDQDKIYLIIELPKNIGEAKQYLEQEFKNVEDLASKYMEKKNQEFNLILTRFYKCLESSTKLLIEKIYENVTTLIEGEWIIEFKKYRKIMINSRTERKFFEEQLKPQLIINEGELEELNKMVMNRYENVIKLIKDSKERIQDLLIKSSKIFLESIELITFGSSQCCIEKNEGIIECLKLDIMKEVEKNEKISYKTQSIQLIKYRNENFLKYNNFINKKWINLNQFFQQELQDEEAWMMNWKQSIKQF